MDGRESVKRMLVFTLAEPEHERQAVDLCTGLPETGRLTASPLARRKAG